MHGIRPLGFGPNTFGVPILGVEDEEAVRKAGVWSRVGRRRSA